MWSIKKFNQFVEKIPTDDTVNFIRNALSKYRVKIIYEKDHKSCDSKTLINRVLLSGKDRSCKFPFIGTILHRYGNKFKVKSYQQKPPINRINKRNLYRMYNKNIKVINANDGTTVTLYWLDDKWVISTHRGYEVNDKKWMNHTFDYLLNDVLSTYENFSYEKLDKNKCYTIGFRHSFNHPFLENNDLKVTEKRAWFIQSIDLNKFNSSDLKYLDTTEDIGIPLQKVLSYTSLDDLFINSYNAYDNYIKTKTVNYGYIVQIKGNQYIIESTLLKHIRKIFYSNRFSNIDKSFNKKKYILIYSFLDPIQYKIIKQLFPQFNEDFKKIYNEINKLINTMIDLYKNNNNTNLDQAESHLKNIAKEMLLYLNMIPNGQVNKYIISQYILHTKYTDIIYKLVYLTQ